VHLQLVNRFNSTKNETESMMKNPLWFVLLAITWTSAASAQDSCTYITADYVASHGPATSDALTNFCLNRYFAGTAEGAMVCDRATAWEIRNLSGNWDGEYNKKYSGPLSDDLCGLPANMTAAAPTVVVAPPAPLPPPSQDDPNYCLDWRAYMYQKYSSDHCLILSCTPGAAGGYLTSATDAAICN
jgi:hypothetical protein